MTLIKLFIEWVRIQYTCYKIRSFVKHASEEELKEWQRDILMECRHNAFEEGDYDLVEEITELLEQF